MARVVQASVAFRLRRGENPDAASFDSSEIGESGKYRDLRNEANLGITAADLQFEYCTSWYLPQLIVLKCEKYSNIYIEKTTAEHFSLEKS